MTSFGSVHLHQDSPRPSKLRCQQRQCLDEVEWDSGGIGLWHKQTRPLRNDNNRSTHPATNNQGTLLKSVNFSKSTEFVEIWDDEFDFCVKDEKEDSSGSELSSANNSPKSKRFSKAKCKEVFIRSKDYIKSKVAICKKKLHSTPFTGKWHSKGDNQEDSHSEQELEDTEVNQEKGLGTDSKSRTNNTSQKCNTKQDSKGHNSSTQEWRYNSLNNSRYCGQFCTGVFASNVLMNGTSLSYQTNRDSPPSSMNGTSQTIQVNDQFTVEKDQNPERNETSTVELYTKQDGRQDKESRREQSTAKSAHVASVVMPGLTKAKTQDDEATTDEVGCTDQQLDNGFHLSKSMDYPGGGTQYSLDEDIPLGSEAHSFEARMQEELSTDTSQSYDVSFPVVDKRLQWLTNDSHQNSFGSEFSQNTNTSTSSDISLDMILNDRCEDPEDILIGLGFGGTEGNEDSVQKIPDRFLSKPSNVEGLELSMLLEENPELAPVLQSLSVEHSSRVSEDSSQEGKSKHESPEHFSNIMNSMMHTMRFVSMVSPHRHAFSSPVSRNNSIHSSDENNTSVLNCENREHLAKQGFYEHNVYNRKSSSGLLGMTPSKSGDQGNRGQLRKTMSLDASERRKMFQKSRTPRQKSLSDLIESDEPRDELKLNFSKSVDSDYNTQSDYNAQSFDYGQRTNFTSIETSTDSFDSSDSPSVYTSASAYVHRGSSAWMGGSIDNGKGDTAFEWPVERKPSISEMRSHQVDQLMSFDLDDGDYKVNSPSVSRESSVEKTLTQNQMRVKLSAMSSCSTLTGDDNLVSEAPVFPEVINEVESESSQFKPLNFEPRTEVRDKNENVLIKEEDGDDSVIDCCDKTSQNITQDEDCDKSINRQRSSDVLTIYFDKNTPADAKDQHVGTKDCGTQVTSEDSVRINVERAPDLYDHKLYGKLGGMGRMESVQSDSSGFTDGDINMEYSQDLHCRVPSRGSSAESDQTFHSSSTLLPSHSCTSPNPFSDLQRGQRTKVKDLVDVAVGTDDLEDHVNPTPSVTYHLHPKEDSDSSHETLDKSVVLTIELPQDLLKSGSQRSEVSFRASSNNEKRVVSHFYKVISPPKDINRQSSAENSLKAGNSYDVQRDKNTWYSRSNQQDNQSESDSASNRMLDFMPDPFVRPIQPKWASTPRTSTSRATSRIKPLPSDSTRRSLRQSGTSSEEFVSVSSMASSQDRKYSYGGNPNRSQELFPLSDDIFSVSTDSSCGSVGEDLLEYTKLMRLVNKPVTFKKETRGTAPAITYKPKYHIKTWNDIQRQQQLQEETRLMQYALQRYKAEINVLETAFLVQSQMAVDNLSAEERQDVKELHFLWNEVRQEIVEMEHLLCDRMNKVQRGNDNFSPLLALDIIHKMIEIIKEQIFQQQVTPYKEDMGPPCDPEPHFQSSQSNVPWWPEVSEQLYDIQQKVSRPPSLYSSEQHLNDSLMELRTSILDEVRQELNSSTRWLHRELENKERELSRLRSDLVANNMKAGQTRVRQFYETDI